MFDKIAAIYLIKCFIPALHRFYSKENRSDQTKISNCTVNLSFEYRSLEVRILAGGGLIKEWSLHLDIIEPPLTLEILITPIEYTSAE